MTPADHLLTVLMEECSEVIQPASKAIRFGLTSRNPNTQIENREAIIQEYYDIVATIEMLQEIKILPKWSEERQNFQKEAKKIKVEKYMKMFNII